MGDCSDYTGPSTIPTNIEAVAGDGQVTISWRIEKPGSPSVVSGVRYPSGGGSGKTCNTKELKDDCLNGCAWTSEIKSVCTITGLTNGTPYTFTVLTATSTSGGDCAGTEYRSTTSASVTPTADLAATAVQNSD